MADGQPTWLTGIKIYNPIKNETSTVGEVQKELTNLQPQIQKEIKEKTEVIRKARVWYDTVVAENPVKKVPGILKSLEPDRLKGLVLNGLDTIEKNHFFRYLVFHPINGDITSLRNEIIRVLNKNELSLLDNKSYYMTGVVVFTHLPEEVALVQQILSFMNTMVTIFSTSPGISQALMKVMTNPDLQGFVDQAKDTLLPGGGFDKAMKDPLVAAINDPKTALNTIIKDTELIGKFLNKSKTTADLIIDQASGGKVGGILGGVPEGKKSKSLFDKESASLEKGGDLVASTTQNPINKWIKTDKINDILQGLNETYAQLQNLLTLPFGAMPMINGVVSTAMNIAEVGKNAASAGAQIIKNIENGSYMKTVTDYIDKIGNIGDEIDFSALVIYPELLNKAEFTQKIQEYVNQEVGPNIPKNSMLYGAMVVCYTEVPMIAELAIKAITLLLGGNVKEKPEELAVKAITTLFEGVIDNDEATIIVKLVVKAGGGEIDLSDEELLITTITTALNDKVNKEQAKELIDVIKGFFGGNPTPAPAPLPVEPVTELPSDISSPDGGVTPTAPPPNEDSGTVPVYDASPPPA